MTGRALQTDMGYIAFITALLLYQVVSEDYQTYVSDSLWELCPYTNTCLRNASEEFPSPMETKQACCQPCNCNARCWITSDCCVDSEFMQNALLTEEQLYIRGNCLQSTFNLPLHTDENNMYLVINYCSLNYTNVWMNYLCTSDPESLSQLQFVSDENDVIYRNKYCAQCNGIGHYTVWPLRLNCDTMYPYQTISLENLKTLSECYTWSEPANITQFEHRICYDTVDKCPEPMVHRRVGNNMFLKKACEEGHYGLYLYRATLQYYKNVFCYLCNFNVTTINHVCATNAIGTKFSRKPFSSILTTDVIEQTDESTDKKCNRDEIYDIFKDSCRDLVCPHFTYPLFGRCVETFSTIEGFEVLIPMKLSSVQLDNYVEAGLIEFDEWGIERYLLAMQLKEMVLSQNKYCKVCNVYISPAKDTGFSDLDASISVEASADCKVSGIQKAVNIFDKGFINLNINGTNVSFYSDITLDEIHTAEVNISRDDMVFRDLKCGDPDIMIGDFKCPRIEISGTDFVDVIKRHGLSIDEYLSRYDISTYDPEMLELVSLEVCIDDYFSMSSGTWSMNFTLSPCTLIILTLSWLNGIL